MASFNYAIHSLNGASGAVLLASLTCVSPPVPGGRVMPVLSIVSERHHNQFHPKRTSYSLLYGVGREAAL